MNISETTTTWEPGDPLYSERNHQHSMYLFNFRGSDDDYTEVCGCGDAAWWPEPRGHHDLGPWDELTDFIAAVRQDEREAS